MIPKSHPQAIAEASAKNTTLSLTIAPAEHDRDCCQVGGKLPVTEKFTKHSRLGMEYVL